MSKQNSEEKCISGYIQHFMEPMPSAPISLYVIHGIDGDMLIDTGFITTYSKMLKWVEINHFRITDIFVTHAHQDHDWNVAKLKRKFGARVWMGAEDVSLIRDFLSQKQIPVAPQYIKKARSSNFWGNTCFFKSAKYTPDVIIHEEGSEVAAKYGYNFKVVKLPGHTKGSIGILAEDVLYCGDAFAVLNEVPTLPPHVVSMDLMKESWQKIINLSPKYLAPGHGKPIEMGLAVEVLEMGLRDNNKR